MSQLGDRIRKARKARGLTQLEVAEKLEMSIGIIERWEAGTRTPRLSALKKLAKVLGCPPGDLL